MLTPFETTGIKTPRSDGEAFLAALANATGITLHNWGYSVDGNPMTSATVGSGPVKVAVIGSIHGTEPAGREACFAYLRDLAETTDPALQSYLASAAWTFMCTGNPDGIDISWRENRNGIDLNRDHNALTQPETQAIYAWLQSTPGPVLIMDMHETSNGAVPDLATATPAHVGVHVDLRARSEALESVIWTAWQGQGWSPVIYPFNRGTAGTMSNEAGRVHYATGMTVETQRGSSLFTLSQRVDRHVVALEAARADHEANATAYDAAHTIAGGGTVDPDPGLQSGLFRTNGDPVSLARTNGDPVTLTT